MDTAGDCIDCPNVAERLSLMLAVTAALGLLLVLATAVCRCLFRLSKRLQRVLHIASGLVEYLAQFGFATKAKVVVSFYQVA